MGVSDRELPRCIACAQSEQRCIYPLRPMKPGPKIGNWCPYLELERRIDRS
jgi:hypothetical protein